MSKSDDLIRSYRFTEVQATLGNMVRVADYPYETRLNILHEPLELIDVNELAANCTFEWFNQTLCKVNGSVVRAAVVQGEYHWHKHDHDDEFFFTLSGELLVDLEERAFTLKPGQGVVVPKGVVHRTWALTRTVILMVETETIQPTGDEATSRDAITGEPAVSRSLTSEISRSPGTP